MLQKSRTKNHKTLSTRYPSDYDENRLYHELDYIANMFNTILERYNETFYFYEKIKLVEKDLKKTIFNKRKYSFVKLAAKIGFYQGILSLNGNFGKFLFHRDEDV